LQGYKAQSEMVMESLDRLISSCAARHESLVCEGVHLSLNFVVQLMQRHPTIVPFLIYISNEDKHKERFAVSTNLWDHKCCEMLLHNNLSFVSYDFRACRNKRGEVAAVFSNIICNKILILVIIIMSTIC